jgi:hypothetical protein
MSSLTHYKSMELAAQVVAAAAQAGSLKLTGVPMGDAAAAKSNGEVDGAYVAALMNTIAATIKTAG